MSGIVEDAVAERLTSDEDPSRSKALGAAIIVGFGAAVLTYRLLRGQSSDTSEEDTT